MGQVIKKVAGFIGAVVVSAIGVVLAPFTGGASIVVAGKIASALVISNVASLAGELVSSSPPTFEETGANARAHAFSDPDALGDFVFGTTATHFSLTFEQPHGINKEQITDVWAHAWHKIESYQKLWVEKELVSFTGQSATGEFAGILTWKQSFGTQIQSAPSLPGTVYGATDKGAGVAYSALTWNLANQTKLKNGVPTQIMAEVQGAHLYDPRLDSTVGGVGSQRYNDQSTWTWNDGNAALVLLRYIIGEYSAAGDLIWGMGADQGDVELASFIAMANVSDEIVDGVPRYRLGGTFATSNVHEDFISRWQDETGGRHARINGKRFVHLPHDDLTSIKTFTTDDVLSSHPIEYSGAGDIAKLYNTGRGRFIDPTKNYQGADFPVVKEAAAIVDDGRARVLPLEYSWIQDRSIAERITRIKIRRSRFQQTWTFALGWEGFLYAPFSVLTINFKSTNFQDQLVRIVDMRMSPTGVVLIKVQEEDPSIYDTTMPLGTPSTANAVPDHIGTLETVTPGIVGQAVDAQISAHSSWSFKSSLDGFTAVGANLTTNVLNASIASTGTDPQFLSPTIAIDGVLATRIRVRIRRTAGTGWDGKVMYVTAGHAATLSHRKEIATDPTILNRPVTIEFDMANLTAGGTDWVDSIITQLRFDFGATAADAFDIMWIIVGDVGVAPGPRATQYTNGEFVDDLRPGEAGANITETRVSSDTSNVGGTAAAAVRDNAELGLNLTTSNGTVLHRSSVDRLLFTAHEDFDMDEGPNRRRLANGLIPFSSRNGNSHTYNPTFSTQPKVRFNAAGTAFDPALNSVTKALFMVRAVTSHTVSGFTSSLLLKERDLGTITNRSLNCNSPATGLQRDTPNKGINDSGTTATVGDSYTLNFVLTLTGFNQAGEDFPGKARVEVYENSSGAFVLKNSTNVAGPDNLTPTNVGGSVGFVQNGIDTADNFRILVVKTSGGSSAVSISGTPTINYQTSDVTGATSVSATPTGVDDVTGDILFNEDTGQVV